MHIGYHIGHCCGIKTIYDLDTGPEINRPPLKAGRKDNLGYRLVCTDADLRGFGCKTISRAKGELQMDDMYPHDLPEEKGIQRFDRLLAYIADIRPFGLVEVAIICRKNDKYGVSVAGGSGAGSEIENLQSFASVECDNFHSFTQDSWIEPLEARGFKHVTSVPNSNSGNIVRVYHLVTDKEWHLSSKKQLVLGSIKQVASSHRYFL